jgi:hypothetical protein
MSGGGPTAKFNSSAAAPVGAVIGHVLYEQQVHVIVNRLLQAHLHQRRWSGWQAPVAQLHLQRRADNTIDSLSCAVHAAVSLLLLLLQLNEESVDCSALTPAAAAVLWLQHASCCKLLPIQLCCASAVCHPAAAS